MEFLVTDVTELGRKSRYELGQYAMAFWAYVARTSPGQLSSLMSTSSIHTLRQLDRVGLQTIAKTLALNTRLCSYSLELTPGEYKSALNNSADGSINPSYYQFCSSFVSYIVDSPISMLKDVTIDIETLKLIKSASLEQLGILQMHISSNALLDVSFCSDFDQRLSDAMSFQQRRIRQIVLMQQRAPDEMLNLLFGVTRNDTKFLCEVKEVSRTPARRGRARHLLPQQKFDDLFFNFHEKLKLPLLDAFMNLFSYFKSHYDDLGYDDIWFSYERYEELRNDNTDAFDDAGINVLENTAIN